jgi:diamine N-acetyltransferase
MKRIRLAEVTAANWEAVIALELRRKQKRLLADNLYSLAESKFDPDACPRAVYAGRKLVGFLMYDASGRGQRRTALIYRFMIDKHHQGKGYGRGALLAAIAEIKALGNVARIKVSYLPRNRDARGLYLSVGFRESGKDEDGECLAELVL